MIDIESKLTSTNSNLIGTKVKLIFTDDPYTKLQPGEVGVINFIDDTGTLHIIWESGSRLGLIPGVDKWEYI